MTPNTLREALKALLDDVSDKLRRYYNTTAGQYVGGIEHSALQRRIRQAKAALAATPAPAVDGCETCGTVGRFYCFTHGPVPTVERETVPERCDHGRLMGEECHNYGCARDATPPAEAREPVDPLVEEGLAYFEKSGDAGDKLYVAAIRRALAQPKATPRDSGDAWQTEPTEPGWYWHYDGEVFRMEWVFKRPGHDYLAIQDEPNEHTGKRQFRMASRVRGKWLHVKVPKAPAMQSPTGEPSNG